MGNCTCSENVEEINERHYPNSDLENVLDEILADIFPRDIEVGYEDSDIENSEGPSNISFERGSVVSRLEHIYIEDDTCGICAYAFDEDQHVPRILPCGHTICHYCIKAIARTCKFRYLECPLDRKCHRIKRQHTARLLANRQVSSTQSLASESVNSDTILSVELTRDNDNTLGSFEQAHLDSISNEEQTHLDSISNDVSESSILDTSELPISNFDIYDTEGRLVYSVQQNSEIDKEMSENENYDSDFNSVVMGINDKSFEMQPQPMRVNDNSQVWTERQQGSGKKLGNLTDVADECTRQMLEYQDFDADDDIGHMVYQDVDAEEDIGPANERKKRHDIYDDERSVRSFEWVEPDYSSESD